MKFSTFDADNDERNGAQLQETSCARLYKVSHSTATKTNKNVNNINTFQFWKRTES